MYIYTAKRIKDHTGGDAWWVIAEEMFDPEKGHKEDHSQELKIAKIPYWVRNPQTVATVMAESLNQNQKHKLYDLI